MGDIITYAIRNAKRLTSDPVLWFCAVRNVIRMEGGLKRVPLKPKAEKNFVLEAWYASEGAKRAFGRICQAVNEEGGKVTLLGTETKPLLLLVDADDRPSDPDEVHITIDEAKANWSGVTTAAALSGTVFRIKGKQHDRAVLCRHPDGQHPAERYMRSNSQSVNRLAQKLEDLAKEIRKIGQKVERALTFGETDFGEVVTRLHASADVIDRRFKEVWRAANGYTAGPA